MPTGNTTLLGLALPVQGELDGTWGNVVNQQLTELLDTAIAGTTTLSTDADVTLTTTVLAANQARQAVLLWTANGTTTRNITAPAQSKPYIVINASAGTQSIVIRGAGPTTGVTLIKGEKALVAWNGTDFVKVASSDGDGTFTTVDTTNLEVTNIKAKDGTAAATIANTTGIITVSSELNVDNLNLSTNTISSTNANGNIVLAPNGTGGVQVDADTLRIGDANANATLTTNGTGDLILNTNAGTNSGSISIQDGVNGNIVLAPNGTGDVQVDADTLRIGDVNAAATLTTNGTGNLTLSTNSGTNSGTVVINQGVNGNIELAPNGTGDVYLTADLTRLGDANANATLTTNGTGDLILNTNSGTNSGSITIQDGLNGNIVLAPNGTGLPIAQLTTAATNTVTPVMRLDSQSSGTPAAGIGVGLQFAAETAVGNTEVGATLEAITTDVTAASEDFDLVISTMAAGAAASEGLRVKNTGGVTIPTGSTYQINNTAVLSATTLGSGVTSSSLTSVGTITSGTWSASTIAVARGGTGQTTYTDGQLLIGNTATTGLNKATLTAGSGVTITNGNGTITIAATGSGGTVTSVGATSPVASSGGTTPTISLNAAYGDTLNPYASKTANFFLAAPNGTAGTPTFRAIVAADIPTLNQNTTGTAANVTGIVAIANGGTGATTLAGANIAVFNASNTFTAAQTFRAANAIRSEAASTQDAVVLAGRAGGTSSFASTLTPTTLTANRTLTLPDNSGTVLTSGATVTIAQGGTNGTATPTAGTVAYGTGTAYAFTAAGTSGQYLQSNGASAPTWATLPTIGNGTLTLAVSGTGLSGSATFTANQSGNATFTVTSNATSANTASTIVARDASNGFSAGAISATTSGGTSTITVQDTGANGANIRLNGNGATTPNKFIRAQNGNFEVVNSAYTALCFSVTDAGNLTATGNVTAYSDERLKKDWAPLASGFIEQLAAIKAGTYTRTDSGERQVGVSAQELQNLLTEAVAVDDKGYLAVAYGNAALVACIELAKEVVALRAELAALR